MLAWFKQRPGATCHWGMMASPNGSIIKVEIRRERDRWAFGTYDGTGSRWSCHGSCPIEGVDVEDARVIAAAHLERFSLCCDQATCEVCKSQVAPRNVMRAWRS